MTTKAKQSCAAYIARPTRARLRMTPSMKMRRTVVLPGSMPSKSRPMLSNTACKRASFQMLRILPTSRLHQPSALLHIGAGRHRARAAARQASAGRLQMHRRRQCVTAAARAPGSFSARPSSHLPTTHQHQQTPFSRQHGVKMEQVNKLGNTNPDICVRLTLTLAFRLSISVSSRSRSRLNLLA